jgi:hypothetical protein
VSEHKRRRAVDQGACTDRAHKSRRTSVEIDTGKLGKLIRLLASDKAGEVVAAAGALKRSLAAANLDFHDLAGAAERGFKPPATPPPQQPSRAVSWGPPLPSPHDWQAMAWYCHFYRDHLRNDQRERTGDFLLGTAFHDSDGRCMPWHIDELRGLVARVRAGLRSTEVVRR